MNAPIENAAPSAPTEGHATYLGGSDIAAIVGLDPFRSQLDVWGEKTGRVVVVPSEAMQAGNDHEASIVRTYGRRLASELSELAYPGPGTLRSPREHWRAATPDAITVRRGHRRVVQAKLVGFGQMHRWGAELDGPDGVPEHVHLQVHWETLHYEERFDVRLDVADVVASIGTDTRIYEVPIDHAMIDELVELGRDWWRRHVEGGEMPEPSAAGDRSTIAALFPRPRVEGLLDASPDVLRLVQDYADARDAAKVADEAKESAAARLCAAIGEAEGFGGPWGRATWKATSRSRTDWKAIADQLGAPADLVAAHTRTTTERRLDVRLKG